MEKSKIKSKSKRAKEKQSKSIKEKATLQQLTTEPQERYDELESAGYGYETEGTRVKLNRDSEEI